MGWRWPWTQTGPAPDTDCPGCAKLRSEFRTLTAEWLTVYEKFTKLFDRLRKRDERASAEPQDEVTAGGPSHPKVELYRRSHALRK